MPESIDGTDLEIARECGATSYSPPPLRAVRGLSFTFDQLTAFADRIRADIEKAALHRMKYHHWPAGADPETDPEDWELFDPNITCEHGCIEVLIVPASVIRSPAADAPTGEVKHG